MLNRIFGIFSVIAIVIGLLFVIAKMPHHVHKHVKVMKLKTGKYKYVFHDTEGGVDVWWYFSSDSGGAVVRNANGTLSFPRGGSWVQGDKPPEEEIDETEIDEANISEDPDTGSVDADATADSSSGADGDGGDGGDSE